LRQEKFEDTKEVIRGWLPFWHLQTFLVIVMSVLCRFTAPDYRFDIFKLFFNCDGQQFHQYKKMNNGYRYKQTCTKPVTCRLFIRTTVSATIKTARLDLTETLLYIVPIIYKCMSIDLCSYEKPTCYWQTLSDIFTYAPFVIMTIRFLPPGL
jgi:hypothetical protein